MAVEMEGLEFQIEATSDEAIKGISALSSTFSKLKKVTKGGLGLGSSVKQLENLNKALDGFHSEKLENLGKALSGLSGMKSTIPSTIPKRITELGQSLQGLSDADIGKLERVGSALRNMSDLSTVKIPKVSVPSASVAPTVNGTTNAEAATSGVEQATSGVQKATSAVNGFKAAVNEISSVTGIAYPFKQIGQALSTVPGKIKQVVGHLRELYTEFKKSGGVVGAFGRMMGNIFKKSSAGMAAGMKAVTSTLGNKLLPITKKTTGALGRLVGAFKRIALYRMIRFVFSQLAQAMKEGINNLYQYSNLMGGTFAQSMDRLATSGQYLKNSLGAMAAPIINALAPAIDFVIDKIATLLNYINMLFARLSGASVFTAAKKNAVSYGDSLTKAGGSAAKAAKEIRDATTGIDELNIIMQKNDDGGGGGGGADYGSMFEELPIDNSVSEFADKLKQAFESADWKALGTIIGDKVNEVKRVIRGGKFDDDTEAFLLKYWEAVAENIEPWKDLKNKEISKVDLRENYIITQSVIIQVLGRLGNYFYLNPNEDLTKVLKGLKKIDWRRSASVWKLRTIRENGRMINNEDAIILTCNVVKKSLSIPLDEAEVTREEKRNKGRLV